MRIFFTGLIVLLMQLQPTFAEATEGFPGLWWNEKKDGIFELVQSGDQIEGITRWGKEPQRDTLNPDPALKDRLLKDVIFLWGFSFYPKKNRWQDGKVYDPNSGKTYDAKLELEDEGSILKMRGFIGSPIFGRTAKFERVKQEDIPEALATEIASR